MKRILVVDDSTFQRIMVAKMVTDAGYEAQTAQNGRECLESLQKQQVDLVLLDLNMPEMDGLQVLEHMSAKEQELQVPVIVLTADIQDSTRKRCMDLGVEAVLNKPPKQAELVSEVEKLL
ncbi:hypothetical protein AKJ60_00180 [candidate division MSBL1 archaeon SCGC-AAA385M11]|nr:hypothetical protein AKJ60_00180 [candidate division MSBL1 archaeon SCGC-AAA385M11]